MGTDGRRGRSDTSAPPPDVQRRPPDPNDQDGPDSVELLLPLALSQPPVALSRAWHVLAGSPGPRAASIAHQVVGVVERDGGRLTEAITELREALRLARQCDNERVADVLATLGVTLTYAGSTRPGMRRLDEAMSLAPRQARPRILLRRAHALWVGGRYTDALGDLDGAIRGSRRDTDRLWEARGLNNRSVVNLALGSTGPAESDARTAEVIFTELGQRLEAAQALHNRAWAAYQRGDLPLALALMDETIGRHRALGSLNGDLVIDHVAMLLTAGLAAEARVLASAALNEGTYPPAKRAVLLLSAAQAALAGHDPTEAERLAGSARRIFGRQHRPWWAERAELLSLQARTSVQEDGRGWVPGRPETRRAGRRRPAGKHSRLGARATTLATSLADARAPEAPVALLLAGRVAVEEGRPVDARANLAAASRSRHTGSPLGRAAGWLAAALLARQEGDRRALLRACRRGLDAVDEHRALLGDLELRALATGHGLELAALAVDEAVRAGNTRALLWWTERWRATALTSASVRPPEDSALERDIAALRDVARRLDATGDGEPGSAALERERTRREADVRRTYRHLRGGGSSVGFDLGAVLEALGETVLLSLVNVGGTLQAVTVAGGRVRRRELGSTRDALREADFARFALRRAAHGRRGDLAATAQQLQSALLGEAIRDWSREHVVLVPPADLLTAPWGLLPAFAETSLTVCPSATMWLRARRAPTTPGHVALVTGPGLSTHQSEVTALSPMYAAARVVGGTAATVAGALDVLEGAGLAHVAAHGTFRADAPLFSSLSMHDGPLMVHDLDRLRQPPRSIVLSACDSGGAAPIGAHEALGLVSSLLALGTSGVLASVVPVNDLATVTVMQHVHAVAGVGGSLADGWLAARRECAGDPLMAATAAAFTAWGA